MKNGRTPPFPGFSRGIPIVGQPRPDAPPAGAYFYQVPALIQRAGAPLAADSFEVRLPTPMVGTQFKRLEGEIAASLAGVEGAPAPKVVLLAPFFLGFVPQEELERQEREQAEAATAPRIES